MSFRNGFYAGLLLALIVGLYLFRLWQPERQVQLHSAHLLAQIEQNDWTAVEEFIAADYRDRWGNDHALLLERLRRVFRVLSKARIEAAAPSARTADGQGYWTAKITITGGGEFAGQIEGRVNALKDPFELEWRRGATWPWDWKLVTVRNPELEISRLQ
jgi:hypothetical protein